MKNKWLTPVLFIFFAFGILAGSACADGVPITGSAGEVGANTAFFEFSGPGTNVYSTTADFSSIILTCTPGSFCPMTITVPSAAAFDGDASLAATGSSGSVSGSSANVIGGSLTFSGGAFIPAGSSLPASFTVPVTVSGTIFGYYFADCPGDCSPSQLLWTLNISGTGEATFVSSSGAPFFDEVGYTFTGTASATPEPASLVLLSIGFLGIFALWYRGRLSALASGPGR